ncbi:MAG: CCA tRNA nucleotidyltransferase [Rhabdochlamydiaceae bacterium]|nr:CCA tRNA nucleotidyltransferase [Rhabdochlamydiaceae bacterium]
MPTRPIATRIVDRLQKAGHIAYFAGGWVRDFLLQVPSDDIDIATSASVEEIAQIFSHTIPVGIAFGILIVVEEGHSFEVATFRKEKEYIDGRRPTSIESATAEEDAQRRDFTINGLFFDPIQEKLWDFVNGQKDIEKGIVRAIGDPHHRFLEDRLRMMRAIRYSTRFGFPIECDTEQAIISHAQSLFPSVAIERIWQEFQKMAKSPRFAEGILSLYKLTLLPVIFPSLKTLEISELQRRLIPLSKLPLSSPLIAKLLFLFPRASLTESLQLCEYLKTSKLEKDLVSFLHSSQSLLHMPLEWQSNVEPVEWAHFYAHPSSSLALEIANFEQADSPPFLHFHAQKKEELSRHIIRIQTKSPLIRAEDLLKEGISPGVQMGKLLKEAEKIAINEDLHEKSIVLEKLKEFYKNP